MDISETTAPRSDQQNFDDYINGPKTVQISEVRAGTAEQPVEIHLAEFLGRPYKPSKSMRRVLVAAWGADASVYVGRKMTLFGDPTVKFGGSTVGGIKISHLSHIDNRLTLSLTATRGKRAPFVVDPLPDGPPSITADAVAEFEQRILNATNIDDLATIAADLKTWELGQHRGPLQTAWGNRRQQLAEGMDQ